jgi:hypothetical protein
MGRRNKGRAEGTLIIRRCWEPLPRRAILNWRGCGREIRVAPIAEGVPHSRKVRALDCGDQSLIVFGGGILCPVAVLLIHRHKYTARRSNLARL